MIEPQSLACRWLLGIYATDGANINYAVFWMPKTI